MPESWQEVAVPGGGVDVELVGGPPSGIPVLVVQTALEVDETRPLAGVLAASDECRVAHLLRAGYGRPGAHGAPAATARGSVGADAEDCEAVAAALGWGPVHVVGASYSSAVALSWAAAHPRSVASVSLLEAPPTHTAAASQLREASERLRATYAESGPGAALDAFMERFVGPGWRAEREAATPGSAARLHRDAPAFFDGDLPAVLDWRFGPAEAAAVRCPVLYVEGTESGPMFAAVGDWVSTLFPSAERASVPGAGHDLDLTHAVEVARIVLSFLRRHSRTRERRRP